MSKERLEEIKMKSNNTTEPMLYVPYSDFNWLIEQAERVQELEEENDELAERVHKLALDWSELVDERNRYKQALERIIDFYPGVSNADFIPVEMLFEIKGIAYRALEREG